MSGAKSFYRMLGTVAGVLMTVALVFAFAQYGELFIASVAVWIGLCSFAARAARNFASYSFQLDRPSRAKHRMSGVP